MSPWLIRRCLFPLHERLVGRRTRRFLAELEDSQWLAPVDLERLQRQKLTAFLRHAVAHTPYYRSRLGPALTHFNHIDLAKLPLLTKDDIRSSMQDMLWHEAPGGLHPHNTGGSCGEPLRFYLDRRRQAFDQAARIRAHRWFGVDLGDRELMLWGSPIEFRRSDGLRRFRDRLFNQRLIDAFNLSPEMMDRYADVWNWFRPRCLFGYPSSIALFVDHVRQRNRWLDRSQLRAVFVTGEVCYPHHRESIESYFQVPVADNYGARDAGFIAHQCPNGRMHITAENVIVEIIKNGLPQPVGQFGEIVITHLDAYGMPFIRYATGDHGRLLDGRCPCGRGLPLMDVVQGRTTDFLRLPDGTVRHALSIIYPLRELPTVRAFRVIQREDFSVEIEVELCNNRVIKNPQAHVGPVFNRSRDGLETQPRLPQQTHNPFHEDQRCAIAKAVRPVLGTTIPIGVRIVDRISPCDSGKHRYVLSLAGTPPNTPS